MDIVLYVFDKNADLVTEIFASEIKEAYYEEEINKPRTLYATFIWREDDNIPRYLAHQDVYNPEIIRLYYIRTIERDDEFLVSESIEAAYDDLGNTPIFEDRRPRKESIYDIFNQIILKNSDWQLGHVDPKPDEEYSVNIYYSSALTAIKKFMNQGLEFDFTADITNGKISNKKINIYYQIGEDRGKRYHYGDNLLHAKKQQNKDEIYTAITPTGRKEEFTNEYGVTTLGYNITIKDVSWSKADGDPVDKPLGQTYIELPEATKVYGLPNGKPRMGFLKYPDEDSRENLMKLAYKDLLRYSKPQVKFTANVRDTGDVNLGDTVSIIRDDIGIRYKTRIFKRTVTLKDPVKAEGSVNYGE